MTPNQREIPEENSTCQPEETILPDNADGLEAPDDQDQTLDMSSDARPRFSVSIEAATESQQAPSLLYPVVAFGASAGGLQAVQEVLENLDVNTGMSFVLVTHLSPTHRSFLTEIVERYTRMPVVPIEDGMRPAPNQLYVMQPNQRLTLREGVFRADEVSAEERLFRAIDIFFQSLAADQKNHAVGVVLSGADSDGALGLKAINARRYAPQLDHCRSRRYGAAARRNCD